METDPGTTLSIAEIVVGTLVFCWVLFVVAWAIRAPATRRPGGYQPDPDPSAVPRPTHYTVYAPHHEAHQHREDPPMPIVKLRTGAAGLQFILDGAKLLARNTTDKPIAATVTITTDRDRVTQANVPANSTVQISQIIDPSLGDAVQYVMDAKPFHGAHTYAIVKSEPFIAFADGSKIDIVTKRCTVDQYEVREYVAGGIPGGYAYEHVTDFVKAIPGPLGKDQKAKAAKP